MLRGLGCLFWDLFFIVFRRTLAGWPRPLGAEGTSRFEGKLARLGRGGSRVLQQITDC